MWEKDIVKEMFFGKAVSIILMNSYLLIIRGSRDFLEIGFKWVLKDKREQSTSQNCRTIIEQLYTPWSQELNESQSNWDTVN